MPVSCEATSLGTAGKLRRVPRFAQDAQLVVSLVSWRGSLIAALIGQDDHVFANPFGSFPQAAGPTPDWRPAQEACRRQLRSSRVFTSASVTCGKSRYHSPTALNHSGVAKQTHSSTSAHNISRAWIEPTGTASTTFLGDRCLANRTAASIVEPVARPSSTRITMWSFRSSGGRPLR